MDNVILHCLMDILNIILVYLMFQYTNLFRFCLQLLDTESKKKIYIYKV